MSFLLISPARKEHKGMPFFARLVTPDDIRLGGGPTAPQSPVKPKSKPLTFPEMRSQPAPLRGTKQGKSETGLLRRPSEAGSQRPENSKDSQPSSPKADNSQANIPQVGSPRIPQAGGNLSNIPPDSVIIPPGTGGSLIFPLKRENLFDRDIIAKSTQKEDEQRQKSTITFDAKEFQYYGYMQKLKEKIEGIWHYPSDAATRGIYGDLYIDFTIKKNGSLGSVELARTSGHQSLDDAAMKALKDAAPFWPLPGGWEKDSLTITGHFIYSLYGVYVR